MRDSGANVNDGRKMIHTLTKELKIVLLLFKSRVSIKENLVG